MSTVFIFLIILLYSFQTLFCTLFNKYYKGNPALSSDVFCVLQGIAIPIVTLCFIGFNFHPSFSTWIIGCVNALALLTYNRSIIKGSSLGPYAFLNITLLFGGLLVPILFNTFYYKVPFTPLQIAAVLLMLLSLVLVNVRDIQLTGIPKAYFICCLLLFISNGAYSTLVSVQSHVCEAEGNQMIIITYMMMGGISALKLAVSERKNAVQAFRIGKKAAVMLTICLLSSAAAINLQVYILPKVNLTVLYTTENGGIMLLSALYSFILFKEKFSRKKIFGIVFAVVSIVALSI